MARTTQTVLLILFGLLLSPMMLRAQTESAAPANVTSGESVRAATVLTIHGNVKAVDKDQKLVTVQIDNGQSYTIKVDNPYNLDAATVGSGVLVRYYDLVTVRKKKAGESLPSLSVKGGVTTAKPGAAPGAVAEEHLKAVVSIVEVDEPKGTVTIKGADGTVETVKANNSKILSHLKPGDDLVITASRATAISIEKAPAN